MSRLIRCALAWGFGCGLAMSFVLLSLHFYTQRPKGWDTRALRMKNAKAEALSLMDEQLAEKSTGTIFTVDLENTTSQDIILPQTLKVMQMVKGTRALHGSLLKLHNEYFIPAHHIVSISLENDDLCAAKVQPQSCFDTYFKDQGEIVIFEETHKYEIRIPMPDLTAPKSRNMSGNPIQNQ